MNGATTFTRILLNLTTLSVKKGLQLVECCISFCHAECHDAKYGRMKNTLTLVTHL
jgi:hypothetical protein